MSKMEISKSIIRDILSTYYKIKEDMRENKVTESDFTFEDIVEMIYEELD